MEIRIDPHTWERAEERGTNVQEIKDVIHSGFPIPARKAKVYDFRQQRHGKYDEQRLLPVKYQVVPEVAAT